MTDDGSPNTSATQQHGCSHLAWNQFLQNMQGTAALSPATYSHPGPLLSDTSLIISDVELQPLLSPIPLFLAWL